jgi:hypothetical protein
MLGEVAQVSAAQALNTRCGAAYGFRNHLPDSMVLVLARRANAPEARGIRKRKKDSRLRDAERLSSAGHLLAGRDQGGVGDNHFHTPVLLATGRGGVVAYR